MVAFLKMSAFSQPFALVTELSEVLADVSNGCILWADYDNDGDFDVLVTGSSIDGPITRLYKNIDFGNDYLLVETGFPDIESSVALWCDFDNDNDLDVLLLGSTNSANYMMVASEAFLFENLGDDNFQSIDTDIVGVISGSADYGDLDNDGDYDLVITGSSDSGNVTRIYRNNGDFNFVQVQTNIPDFHEGEVELADYDNDFDLDILISGYYKEGSVQTRGLKLFQNNNDFDFSFVDTGFIGLSESNVAWADYDADGDMDILANGSTDAPTHLVYIYRNDGDDVFLNTGIEIFGSVDGSLAWGDYDNDGDFDFLLTGLASYQNSPIIEIYRNIDGSIFNKDEDVDLPKMYTGNAVWGDYDNEGDLDILICGTKQINGNGESSLFENKNTSINSVPASPDNLQAEVSENNVFLSWDPAFDPETPASGLSYNLRMGTSPGSNDIISSMTANGGTSLLANMGNVNQNLGWQINHLDDGTYFWAVQTVDAGFKYSVFSEEHSFTISNVGYTDLEPVNESMIEIENYPNPFTESTNIKLSIPFKSEIEISIVDFRGSLISNIYNGSITSGDHMFKWNVAGELNSLKPGVYYILVSSKKSLQYKSILLLK